MEPPTNSESDGQKPTLVRGLGLLDSVLLLVSGIIGSSIFLTAKDIAGPLPQPVLFLLVWVLGALISLCACFAFAELGSMFPDSGGQYIYLREAYGDLIAFLYGWMLFAVANGGSIAALSVASAAYLGQVVPFVSQEHVLFTVLGVAFTRAHLLGLLLIAILTFVNVVGLRWGALLQNVSTWTKFAAMSSFVVLGFAIGKGHWSNFQSHGLPVMSGMGPMQLFSALGVGLIAVFWAYDGWVYITWVAGEVKEPRRNVPLAMVLGVVVVGIIYIAMNLTYMYALPLSEIAKHETIAHASAAVLFSPRAAGLLSLMIAISCFSAAATCTLSGARVYLAMAQDGVFFKRMAVIHPKWRTPAFSLIGQGIWAAATHSQRALRPALHLRHFWHGAVVYAYRHRTILAAMEAPGHSPALPLHGISLAPSHLYIHRRGMDPEHHHHAAARGVLGKLHCADRDSRVFVLEAQQPQGRERVSPGVMQARRFTPGSQFSAPD